MMSRAQNLNCLLQTARFARGNKHNDASTFVFLFFRLWGKSKPPAMGVVVYSKPTPGPIAASMAELNLR
jgi:hypothetical protein